MRLDQALPGKIPENVSTETVDAGGVPAEWVTIAGVSNDHVMLYLHGGGYVFGGPDSHRDLAWRLAKECGIRVLVADYRLAPEHPFPGAVDDATACYRWLLAEGYIADNLVVAGDSAGGGLSVALMVNLRNLGLPLPKAAVLISPWTDLSGSGESMKTNADADPMLAPAAIDRFARYYLGDRDPQAPLASPVFADLSALPPMFVLVGSTEVLLSDSERLVERVNEAGGKASLDIWPRMPHVFPLLAGLIPEGRKAVSDIGEFVRGALGTSAVN